MKTAIARPCIQRVPDTDNRLTDKQAIAFNARRVPVRLHGRRRAPVAMSAARILDSAPRMPAIGEEVPWE